MSIVPTNNAPVSVNNNNNANENLAENNAVEVVPLPPPSNATVVSHTSVEGGIQGQYLVWGEIMFLFLFYVLFSMVELIAHWFIERAYTLTTNIQQRNRQKVAWHYIVLLISAVGFAFAFALTTTQGEKNDSYHKVFKWGDTLSGTKGKLGEPFR